MGNFIAVAKKTDVSPGHKKTVTVEGRQIVLANVDGQFFAIGDVCTHAGCSLGGKGVLNGTVVTCGCHGGQFDVTTGKVIGPPPTEDEPSYKVKVEGEDIFIYV